MSDLKLVRSRVLQRIYKRTHEGSLPLEEACRRMEEGEDLLTLACSLDLIDEEQEAHFRQHWFGRGGYFGGYEVEPILRTAFIQSARMAHALRVPIAGFWLSGVGTFVAPVLPSPLLITLLVLTPAIPDLREDRPSFLFGTGTEVEIPGIYFK
jgi:hypothetical protein